VKRPRVLLVDDIPEVSEYCAGILQDEYEVVGIAQSGEAALSAAALVAPDVIVLDISMPGLDGIEVAKRLRSSGSRAVIVFLSAEDHLLGPALQAGGSAYVSKSLAVSHLLRAISEALAGRQFVAIRRDADPTIDPGRARD
jgi:two-component system response regulator AlgR